MRKERLFLTDDQRVHLTALGDILDHAAAREVLKRLLPAFASAPIPNTARAMPLRTCLEYAGDAIPGAVKEALGAVKEALAQALLELNPR